LQNILAQKRRITKDKLAAVNKKWEEDYIPPGSKKLSSPLLLAKKRIAATIAQKYTNSENLIKRA
jgi:hypothetical protein